MTDDELMNACARIDLSETDPERMREQDDLLLECARRLVMRALAEARAASVPSVHLNFELRIGPLSKSVNALSCSGYVPMRIPISDSTFSVR